MVPSYPHSRTGNSPRPGWRLPAVPRGTYPWVPAPLLGEPASPVRSLAEALPASVVRPIALRTSVLKAVVERYSGAALALRRRRLAIGSGVVEFVTAHGPWGYLVNVRARECLFAPPHPSPPLLRIGRRAGHVIRPTPSSALHPPLAGRNRLRTPANPAGNSLVPCCPFTASKCGPPWGGHLRLGGSESTLQFPCPIRSALRTSGTHELQSQSPPVESASG